MKFNQEVKTHFCFVLSEEWGIRRTISSFSCPKPLSESKTRTEPVHRKPETKLGRLGVNDVDISSLLSGRTQTVLLTIDELFRGSHSVVYVWLTRSVVGTGTFTSLNNLCLYGRVTRDENEGAWYTLLTRSLKQCKTYGPLKIVYYPSGGPKS